MAKVRRASVVTEKSNSRWSSADVSTLCRLASNGATSEDIGNELGRSPKAIQQKVSKMRKQVSGIPTMTYKRKAKATATIEELFPEPATAIKANPKHYLRHVTYHNKEEAKKLGALWDGMCWFIPNTVQGEARLELEALYGPSAYGNHSRRGKGQWDTFIYAPIDADVQLDDILFGDDEDIPEAKVEEIRKDEPVPGNTYVKPKPKRVTQTEPTYPHHITVRIPKVLLATWGAGVILAAVGVCGWFIGRGF
tara:strand:+ start:1248 stop:2000 length:753 start_codon:yes stop_codon:yes gene_type:complete